MSEIESLMKRYQEDKEGFLEETIKLCESAEREMRDFGKKLIALKKIKGERFFNDVLRGVFEESGLAALPDEERKQFIDECIRLATDH